MSITRIGPVRVVGHSHSGGCGSSALQCELPHRAEESSKINTREQRPENTVRETRCSVRTGPGAGCARDRSSSCTLGSQH